MERDDVRILRSSQSLDFSLPEFTRSLGDGKNPLDSNSLVGLKNREKRKIKIKINVRKSFPSATRNAQSPAKV
jgi:hypothetical protein